MLIGCAGHDDIRFECLPKNISLNGKHLKCYYSIYSFIPDDVKGHNNEYFSDLLIGYICRTNDRLELIVVNDHYESLDILIDTFNSIIETGTVDIEIVGKNWSGGTWHGVMTVKKEDPEYYCGFGAYFSNVFDNKLWEKSMLLRDNSYERERVYFQKLYMRRKIIN